MPIIHFFNEDIQYLVRRKTLLRNWILLTIKAEKRKLEEISFILCSDQFLLQINQEFLDHEDYTDIITFQYNESGQKIQGDIYISLERVRENAIKYNQRLLDEIHRIIIHGVLHLIGYQDKSINDKEEMSRKEDYYLSLRTEKLRSY
jgi:rRNA maturation RNase YbeY